MMETIEAIHTRRSIRSFLPDPVSDAQMDTIIQAAAAAPNGGNAQMWVIIDVRDPRRIAALRSLAPGIIGLPPALLILCLDKRRRTAKEEGKLAAMPYYDIGAAMQNILLACRDMGLGGCPVGSFHPEALSAFLNLPAEVEPCLLIMLGTPKVTPKMPRKRPLAEIYFKERYEDGDGNR